MDIETESVAVETDVGGFPLLPVPRVKPGGRVLDTRRSSGVGGLSSHFNRISGLTRSRSLIGRFVEDARRITTDGVLLG
ncbi:hypothetical protein EYF80_065353 [Liparis tanakae]|uniref:Uncharacterized protein n=1 Tax=Liparis tanakae TaxID=230148 RepID=A0A4Z2E6Y9_9TELE|nr:hypothetical protein EYF80_065353 [Liparis tanakae]